MGTADYLAPETIRQPDKILPVSDVYSLGCTLYYAVTGKVPFPGGNTADKIRRHLDETPLNPLHFNPDLPEAFLRRDRRDDGQEPGHAHADGAAVVELLRPWCDENATRHMAETSPAASGFHRVVTATPPPAAALDETASFVTDDADAMPGQLDSPSQISQGTASMANEMEDTLAGVHAPRRTPSRPSTESTSGTKSVRWHNIAIAAALIAAATAAAWIAGLF